MKMNYLYLIAALLVLSQIVNGAPRLSFDTEIDGCICPLQNSGQPPCSSDSDCGGCCMCGGSEPNRYCTPGMHCPPCKKGAHSAKLPWVNDIPPSVNDIPPPSVNDVPPPSVNDIPPPSVNDIPPPSVNDIPPPSVNNIPPPSENDIPPPSVNDIPPPSVNDIPPPPVNDIPPPSVNDIPPPPVNNIPPPSVNDIPPPSVNDIPPPSVNDIPPPSVNDIPPPSVNDIPPPSVNDIPPPSVNDIPPPSVGEDECNTARDCGYCFKCKNHRCLHDDFFCEPHNRLKNAEAVETPLVKDIPPPTGHCYTTEDCGPCHVCDSNGICMPISDCTPEEN